MKKILVTGGCGFIGSNFVRYALPTFPDWQVVNLDLLTYAGTVENVRDLENHPRYSFVQGDIADEKAVGEIMASGVHAVLNFAAESHVDRSLYQPQDFVRTNIIGTTVLLEQARKHGVRKFVQVSTDEVYGSIPEGTRAREDSALNASSPYSATKAAADVIALSYVKAYQVPVVITRSSNNYGPYQFPEKLIPLFVTRALRGEEVPLYGDGLNVRDWLHVEDNCRAIAAVLERGREGEVYNIGGGSELPNIAVAGAIMKIAGCPESRIKYVKDRPGHDRRYAMDTGKIRAELGWKPQVPFESGLKRTVGWYREHAGWVEKVTGKEFQEFYQLHYGREHR